MQVPLSRVVLFVFVLKLLIPFILRRTVRQARAVVITKTERNACAARGTKRSYQAKERAHPLKRGKGHMSEMTQLRKSLNTMQEEMLTMYKAMRCSEAQMIVQLCGIPITFDLWSFDQRKEIMKALNRGKGGRIEQALERFGYRKTRRTSKGISFRHHLLPELYAPLMVTNGADIFTEWPADLVNHIYLNDVVLYKQNIVAKARMTRILNGTTTSRKRVRDETTPPDDTWKRACMEETHTSDDDAAEEEDEYSLGGF